MKPVEYINKYNFNERFSTDSFLDDLKNDFIEELKKTNGTKSLKGYEQCIRVIRSKWIAISNRTDKGLDEKVWAYFYASYIAKEREVIFPGEMKKRIETKNEKRDDINNIANFLMWG